MKFCNKCKNNLPLAEFGANKTKSDGLQVHCLACNRAYNKRHYKKNRRQYLERNLKTKKRIRDYVRKAKDKECADCGEKYHYCQMDFDHLDSNTKIENLSSLHKFGSIEKVKQEIEKCDLVCANCHRLRTFSRSY